MRDGRKQLDLNKLLNIKGEKDSASQREQGRAPKPHRASLHQV